MTIEDVTDEFGMLAVQGPRSRQILAKLAPEVDGLGFFEHADAKIGKAPVTDLAHRLHRRPRLRGPGRRRTTRSTSSTR